MSTCSMTQELQRKKCQPCEGGVPPLSATQIAQLLPAVPGWRLAANGKAIRREWKMRDFPAAMQFFNKVADLAEAEGHHPDLHLTGYRHVAVEIFTHAIDGLSENDFILAAKIDALPVALKSE